MAREIQFKEIGGVKYICEMMPATQANKTLISLTEIIGRPAVSMIAKAFTDDGDIEIDDLAGIGLASMFERFDEDVGDRMIKSVLTGVRAEGVSDLAKEFDEHFRGRILDLYKVFAWALEVNYKDFFDAARSSALISKLSSVGVKARSLLTSTTPSSDLSPPTKGST